MLTKPRFFSWLANAMTAANQVKVFQALLLARQSFQSSTPVTNRTVTPTIAAAVLLTPANTQMYSAKPGAKKRYSPHDLTPLILEWTSV